MEETREQQSVYRFLQFAIYLYIGLDIYLFIYAHRLIGSDFFQRYGLDEMTIRLARLTMFQTPLYSKLCALLLICIVTIGTLSKKKKDMDLKKAVLIPLPLGLIFFFSSILFYYGTGPPVLPGTNWYDLAYILLLIAGSLFIHLSLDNISKFFSSRLGKDRWNIEEESFMQPTQPKISDYSVNIPMEFYYRGKVLKGFIPLENLFRGCLVIGVPGSGKSFSVIMPIIRQMVARSFTLCVYDLKFPDLGKIAYYHYLLAKQSGKCRDFSFHVINLNDPSRSRRINPFKSEYIRTLADASETAEALVEALKKGDKSAGSDQFFTQSAINFLAACIYFFSTYRDGKYSSFPHVLSFLNRTYEEIFTVLFTNKELESLLSPFMTAYKARAFDQLEGQVGTLKIFISRMATKETFWVFSGDDFELQISNPDHPAILILANDPMTQSINSACLSVVVNRVTKLVNAKGNLPVGLIIDEAPSLFLYRIEQVLSQARSNLVATVLGIQSMQQFQQQYGKETSSTISSIVGNILSGNVQNKETLDWLERIFGKVKQLGESISIDRTKTSLSLSEKLEPLIPAGKIASLRSGEMVGIVASNAVEKFTGKFETSAINCRIQIDMDALRAEEKAYRELPVYYEFKDKKSTILFENFIRINDEVDQIVIGYKPNIQRTEGQSMNTNNNTQNNRSDEPATK